MELYPYHCITQSRVHPTIILLEYQLRASLLYLTCTSVNLLMYSADIEYQLRASLLYLTWTSVNLLVYSADNPYVRSAWSFGGDTKIGELVASEQGILGN